MINIDRRVCIKTIAILSGLYLTLFVPGKTSPLIYTAPSTDQNGSFEGEVPIKQIGPLLLPKAVVQFRGSDVNVLAVPDWLFDRNVVLSGTLVNAQIEVKNKTTNLRGLVYFSGGLWLTNLGSSNAIDVIDTVSGEQLRGRIRASLDNAFAFKPEDRPMRKLALAEIKSINSPRAYIFLVPTESGKVVPSSNSLQFDSNTISFASTFGHGLLTGHATLPNSTLAGTEPGITKTQIGTFIGLNIANELAPAIAIPLVLNKGTESQALREIKFYNSTLQRSQGIPVPIQY